MVCSAHSNRHVAFPALGLKAEIVVRELVDEDQPAEHIARTIITGKDGVLVSFTWQADSMMSVRFEIIASGDRR